MIPKPTTFIIIILVILLTISVIGNRLLYVRATQYYTQLNATRLDPFGLDVYPDIMNTPSQTNRKRVLFFGDSRAAEWPAPTAMPGFEFINRGIGGETSSQSAGRFNQHVVPQQPQIILIQICVNDLKTIAIFPSQRDKIVNRCQANLQRLVEQSHHLKATIILTTIFPLGQVPLERRPFWSDEVGIAIDEVNQFIHQLATEQVIIFDTSKLLADEHGQVKPAYSRDLLHLSEAGYQALNDRLREILAKL